MRKPWSTLAALALLAPLGLHAPTQAQSSPAASAASAASARVIVKFKSSSPLLRRQAQATAAGERAAALSDRVGVRLAAGLSISERKQVVTARGLTSEALAARLAAQDDVEYAVPDRRRQRAAPPNDTRYTSVAGVGPAVGQWYLRAPSGNVRSSIDVEPAWDRAPSSSPVVVAVLDTGIRDDHGDLAAHLLPGYDMVAPEPDEPTNFFTANDGNGRDPDPSDPGDAVSAGECGNGVPEFDESSSWHGTQTAGLIGAVTDNSLGMASVGREHVRVLPVRVLGKCGGYDSDIQAGMRWAVGLAVPGVPDNPLANRAKVINMSLGGDGPCDNGYPEEVAAVLATGAVVVVSAGNSEGLAVSAPANCTGVIAVAGLRHVGSKVGFSNVGSEVTLAAPGGNCINVGVGEPCLYPILTTTNSGNIAPVAAPTGSTYSNSSNYSVGTSFSAPLVSGTVGLMLATRPDMTQAEVRTALQGSARVFPNSGSDTTTAVPACHAPDGSRQAECYCTTSTCGAGMLDAGRAVQAAVDGLQARIGVNSSSPRAGQALTFNASGTYVAAPDTVTSYAWSLVEGGGIVTALTGANGPTLAVTPSGGGRFIVRLTVTDSQGAQSSSDRAVDVSPALVSGGDGGGGGGGALGVAWLAGLAMAVVALWRQRNRRGRAHSMQEAGSHRG